MKKEESKAIKEMFGKQTKERYSKLKIWLKQIGLIDKIRILSFDRSLRLRNKYKHVFLNKNIDNFLWNCFINEEYYERINNYSRESKKIKEILSKHCKNEEIYLMLNASDDLFILVASKNLVLTLLKEHLNSDVYLFDKSFDWTICLNHHGEIFLAKRDKGEENE